MVGRPNASEPVYVDTDLGTHVVVPVSPEITAKDFNREFEMVHLNCFPHIGNIRVRGLMVKKNSYYYHLSEIFPLKYAFRGSDDPWCLHIHVVCIPGDSNAMHIPVNSVVGVNDPVNCNRPSSCIYRKGVKCKRKKTSIPRWFGFGALLAKHFGLKRKRPRKRAKNNPELERKSKCAVVAEINCDEECKPIAPADARNEISSETFSVVAEINCDEECKPIAPADTHNEVSSETVCVSEIIKKYFLDYDEEVSSPCTPFSAVGHKPKEILDRVGYCEFLKGGSDLVATPARLHVLRRESRKRTSEPSLQKSKTPEVGRRLLLASESLGLNRSCNRPVLSLCEFSNSKSSHVVRNLVFELDDEGD